MFFPTRILHFNANVFKGGGSCMLQEPHGKYQHQLRACVFKPSEAQCSAE